MRDPLTPARTLGIVAIAALASALALVAASMAGSVHVDFASVLVALFGGVPGSPDAAAIVLSLRLPRALCAFAVGGLLALAGTLLQVVLRNPLADPYVLGVSGGAAVGALGAILVGAVAFVAPAAFAGAVVSTAIVFTLAGPRDARASPRLLLTGVVLAAGGAPLIALIRSMAPWAQVKGRL
jgi:iron complex transport system permease protein